MTRIIFSILAFLFLIPSMVLAQKNKFVVSGRVFDQNTGEALIGATVYDEAGMAGTSTNAQGYYSLKYAAADSARITVSFIGYESRSFIPDTLKTIKNVYLSPVTRQLNEVVVTADNAGNVQKAQTSAFMVNKTELLTLPSLASEPDLNLYLQLTPGVSFAGDGNSNLYVRGGSHDQNLFLLDDMPLFHVSHFGGFFSTFNADIINSATLYKGGFPARHGGRLSSVVDVHTYDGDLYKFNGKLTLGLLFSKIAVNGPISKGKSSYNISFRKNLFNYFNLISNANIDFGFYDANVKLSAGLSDVDKVYFSFYAGNDLFGFHDGTDSTGFSKNSTSWGNLAASVRYNRIFSPSLFGNFIIGHSNYHFNEYRLMKLDSVSEDERVHYENDFKSDISCEFAKAHFEWNIRNNVRLFSGYEFNLYCYNPGNAHIIQKFPGLENAEGDYGYGNSYSIENNLFAELIFEGVHGFSGNIGIRPSLLSIPNKSFFSFQPRVSLSYSLLKNLVIKTSYTHINQAFHVLTSTGTGFSSDYRIPVFDMAPPSESEQYVMGVEFKPRPGYEISLEAYSKYMDYLVMKKPGARYTVDYNSWEKTIETGGKGLSEGLELLVRKTRGRFTGWVGLTWQSGRRWFENINNGNPFPFDYDRTWEVNCSGQYPITENMNLGLNWIYATGIPANVPEWYYDDIDGNSVFLYKGYNSSRQRDYHRLDLSLAMNGDHGDWNISIMNVYCRKNPYFYEVSIRDNKPELNEHHLFTIIPTFSYTFKF